MSFDSPLFLLFLSAFWLSYALLGEWRRQLLFLAGPLFLAAGNLSSATVFIAYLGASFLLATAVSRFPKQRRGIFIFAIAANLIALLILRFNQEKSGFFPLGFSFYSFAGFTYLASAYSQNARLRFLEYGAALGFFPTLTSGPICHVPDLARKIEVSYSIDWPRARSAAVRIANGFFKKGISELIVHALMPTVSWAPHDSGWSAWLMVIIFAAKFYADFSGYSDIAIGVSGLLGIDVPENFNLPFLARSIGEYWRRWHISLNVWVNAYIFRPMIYSDALVFLRAFPFMGSFIFSRRYFFAAIAAMFVTGIWHGLTWCFAIWGLYMGILLCLEMAFASHFANWPALLKRIWTFFLVLNGFAIFMSKDLNDLAERFFAMYANSLFKEMQNAWPYFIVVAAALLIPHSVDFILKKNDYGRRSPVFAITTCGILLSLHFFLDGFHGAPFEYFRF